MLILQSRGADEAFALGDVATWVATIVALAALFVGVATLLSTARSTRLQHMHTMFKDYLRLQFEYNAHSGDGNCQTILLRGNLGGFKMYTLEEMILWLKRENAWRYVYFWSRFHRHHIKSWHATVKWHLDQCSTEDIVDFFRASSCYGPDMKAEVCASLERRHFAERHESTGSTDGAAPPFVPPS